jgi:hypothetical protein
MSWIKTTIILLLLAGCGNNKDIAEKKVKSHEVSSIVWQRERCRGTCKEFTMKIDSNGSSSLRSGENMKLKGDLTMKLSKGFVDSLFTGINDCTKGMSTDYNPNVSDFQKVSLTIQRSDGLTIITGMNKVPDCYSKLAEQLDELANSSEWR